MINIAHLEYRCRLKMSHTIFLSIISARCDKTMIKTFNVCVTVYQKLSDEHLAVWHVNGLKKKTIFLTLKVSRDFSRYGQPFLMTSPGHQMY